MSKTTSNKPEPRDNPDRSLSPSTAIGDQLRRVYADVLAEPIPKEITDLVRQIERKRREGDA